MGGGHPKSLESQSAIWKAATLPPSLLKYLHYYQLTLCYVVPALYEPCFLHHVEFVSSSVKISPNASREKLSSWASGIKQVANSKFVLLRKRKDSERDRVSLTHPSTNDATKERAIWGTRKWERGVNICLAPDAMVYLEKREEWMRHRITRGLEREAGCGLSAQNQ